MRPKVKVVVAVWGETYIERFSALALPSFLAPGNLPALAATTELEFLVMTSEEGAAFFEGRPVFGRLTRACPARFIMIDNLIGSGAYGVTLTLAYMRGVASAGEEMVNTSFVFLNSDFVLADGSLSTLSKHILQGRRCILAPSFRAVAEDIEPLLEEAVDHATGVLAMKPRDMVRLALQYVHPTTIARTVNQSLFRSLHFNQLYWHVDEHTLLARFYLIFMLCIRPERVVRRINSYCDYAFVPEMCPSGDITVLTDSDDFFMLETQRRLQEMDHLRIGTPRPDEIAKSLSEWATREHRLVAKYALLFHSESLPPDLDKIEVEADRYIEDIARRLPQPKDHAFHYYWVAGVEAWRQHLRHLGLSGDAPEIATEDRSVRAAFSLAARIFRAMYVVALGTRPFVRIWHHDWSDYRVIRREVRRILSNREARILFIGDAQNPVAAYFQQADQRVTRVDRRRFLSSDPDGVPIGGGGFDGIVCMLGLDDLRTARDESVQRSLGLLRNDGDLILLIMHTPSRMAAVGDITEEFIAFMTRIPLFLLSGASVTFCGGVIKEVIRQWFNRLGRAFYRHGIRSILVIAPALAGLFLLNIVNNIYAVWLRNPRNPIPYCSTLVLRFKKDLRRRGDQARALGA